jgi:tRNA A-37 threonylcarbamoyl transferase component Bud32
MKPVSQVLAEFAVAVLGESEQVAGPSLPPHLIRMRDTAGRSYVAKLHRSKERFLREHHAYTTWATVLGDQAPRLVAADDNLGALLLTALPGASADSIRPHTREELVTHRGAGRLLRHFHSAQPSRFDAHMGRDLASRLRRWIDRADGLLTLSERRTLLRHVLALDTAAPMEVTACHLDFQPRNWTLHRGTVHLLDFEHARVDARVRDFARLHYRHWIQRPELRDAFFAGYEHEMTSREREILRHFGAIEAATSLVRARDTGDHDLAAHGRNVLTQID